MFRKLKLTPLSSHNSIIEFEWDSDLGEVRGKDADQVLTMIKYALYSGEVSIDPMPSTIEVHAPLTTIPEMAAILGQLYQLPDDLQAAIPKLPEDNDIPTVTGADGIERPIDLLH